MKKAILTTVLTAGLLSPIFTHAQQDLDKLLDDSSNKDTDKVTATFKSGNLINNKTTETIHKKELDFRIDHRFGDLAGKAGGVKNFFGLDNAADIRIGFDYGLLDNLTIGVGRAKGATQVSQLYETSVKYRFLNQTVDNKIPVSIAYFGSITAAAVEKSDDPTSPISYQNFSDRLTYVSQIIIARKFSSAFSMLVSPTYLHRNYTAYADQNSVFAVGIGGRLKVSNRMAIVADYFLPFRNESNKKFIEEARDQKYYNALGVGLEIETGGHVFHLNFTNARAVQESQYITETTSTWSKGQFRWGFSIARRFSFDKKTKE